jgi:hypothetical protein
MRRFKSLKLGKSGGGSTSGGGGSDDEETEATTLETSTDHLNSSSGGGRDFIAPDPVQCSTYEGVVEKYAKQRTGRGVWHERHMELTSAEIIIRKRATDKKATRRILLPTITSVIVSTKRIHAMAMMCVGEDKPMCIASATARAYTAWLVVLANAGLRVEVDIVALVSVQLDNNRASGMGGGGGRGSLAPLVVIFKREEAIFIAWDAMHRKRTALELRRDNLKKEESRSRLMLELDKNMMRGGRQKSLSPRSLRGRSSSPSAINGRSPHLRCSSNPSIAISTKDSTRATSPRRLHVKKLEDETLQRPTASPSSGRGRAVDCGERDRKYNRMNTLARNQLSKSTPNLDSVNEMDVDSDSSSELPSPRSRLGGGGDTPPPLSKPVHYHHHHHHHHRYE